LAPDERPTEVRDWAALEKSVRISEKAWRLMKREAGLRFL
jgi:hypothetical protein